MSANWDRTGKTAFYFGNAAKDLTHILPPEENSNESRSELIQEIDTLLSQIENHMMGLNESQRKLKFLLQDIFRIIK